MVLTFIASAVFPHGRSLDSAPHSLDNVLWCSGGKRVTKRRRRAESWPKRQGLVCSWRLTGRKYAVPARLFLLPPM